jgi:hypothetical protein
MLQCRACCHDKQSYSSVVKMGVAGRGGMLLCYRDKQNNPNLGSCSKLKLYKYIIKCNVSNVASAYDRTPVLGRAEIYINIDDQFFIGKG